MDDVFLGTEQPVTWTFTATSGEVILLRTAMVGSDGAKPWAILYAPDGVPVATNYFNGGDVEAIITHTASQTGIYSLECWTYSLNTTGRYRLGLALSHSPFVVQDDGGTTQSGAKIEGSLDRADIDIWSIDVEAGEEIFLRGASVGTNGVKPWLRLYDPDGNLAASSYYNGGDVEDVISHKAAAAGTYLIVVSSWIAGDDGTYRLGVALSRGPFAVDDEGGTTQSGARIDGTLERADIDMWSIEVGAGEEIFIRAATVGANGVKPWVRLYDPDGGLTQSGYYNGGDSEDIIVHTATNGGKYLIVVSSWIGGDDGTYRLGIALSRGPFAVDDEGGVLTGNAHLGGTLELADIDIWAFPASVGTTINITAAVAAGGGAKPWVRLYDPDGNLAASGHFNGGDTVDFVTHQVAQSGTFLAVVSSWTGTGRYTLDFTFTPPPLPPIVFIPGIGGSRLTGGMHTGAHGNGSYLWPTVRPDKISALNLTTGAGDVSAVDAIRYFDLEEDTGLPLPLPPLPFYGPFLEYLQATGYVPYDLNEDPARLDGSHMLAQTWTNKPNLFVFPYDWRLDNATHTALLNDYINSIRQLHNGAKVHIIAHSMGGLLARRYLLDYGTGAVASVTTVGSPIWGAPQAIFRLLTGSFFGPDTTSVIDWIDQDELKDALWSMPAVAQLLPVNEYLLFTGGTVFAEMGWDFNNNGNAHEIYNPLDYTEMMTAEAAAEGSPFNPILVNELFNNPLQTDWSDLPKSLPGLQITGHSLKHGIFESTTIALQARSGPWWQSTNPGGINANIFEYQRLDPVYGPGDGTVPLLSAQRLEGFRPPNLQSMNVTGGSEASHMGLLSENAQVWQAIRNFVVTGISGYPEALPVQRNIQVLAASPAAQLTSVVIKGKSFVNIRDSAGNQNTRLSPAAVLHVPNVDAVYGKNSLRVEFAASDEITIGSDTNNEGISIEIEVFQFNVSGTERTADALERFRFSTGQNAWQLTYNTNGNTLAIDSDGNGVFGPQEAITPIYSGSGTNLDVTPPVVGVELSMVDGELIVSCDGTDQTTGASIYYSLDDGPVENYSTPLNLDVKQSARLRVFAEDGAGNTSGLIETSLNPALDSTISSDRKTLHVDWPVAEAYVLELSESPTGPWETYKGQISRDGSKQSVNLQTDTLKQFLRLRSMHVER